MRAAPHEQRATHAATRLPWLPPYTRTCRAHFTHTQVQCQLVKVLVASAGTLEFRDPNAAQHADPEFVGVEPGGRMLGRGRLMWSKKCRAYSRRSTVRAAPVPLGSWVVYALWVALCMRVSCRASHARHALGRGHARAHCAAA